MKYKLPRIWALQLIAEILLFVTQIQGAVVAPSWSDPNLNPCAALPGGWQLLYWAPLQKCFKIFQIGYPCPDTMELGPAPTNSLMSKKQQNFSAECRCPPGTIQSDKTNKCYRIFERGPCELGEYFGPIPDIVEKSSPSKPRWGTCKIPGPCLEGMIFWPQNGKCYTKHTRGPCAKGKLLTINKDRISECKCENKGELANYYHNEGSCHEHYTFGPCERYGDLFLPGGQCGCHSNLPHYHRDSNLCYEIGTPGPCASGHIFLISDNVSTTEMQATCQCKEGYIPWTDGLCYRLYTQGPCKNGEFLVNSTYCIKNPCGKGRLYFPEENTCYRIGFKGPCSMHQVVIFDLTTRPSIDGISYNGVCGCSGVIMNLEQKCGSKESFDTTCESIPGMIDFNGQCYKLYSRGPCGPGQWLERAKSYENDNKITGNAECRCRPGYTSYRSESGVIGCHAPSVGLARYLNGQKSRGYKFEFRRFVMLHGTEPSI